MVQAQAKETWNSGSGDGNGEDSNMKIWVGLIAPAIDGKWGLLDFAFGRLVCQYDLILTWLHLQRSCFQIKLQS